MKDIGAGAFTGCHKVREIDVTFVENEKSCLRELLMELPEEQTIFYHSKQGEAKLIFPEFFEEAVENNACEDFGDTHAWKWYDVPELFCSARTSVSSVR